MSEKLTWEQYKAKFPMPYDIAQYVGKPLSEYPANYDEMRKANMRWQAVYWREHANYIGPEAFLNPFVAGGWYYGMNGTLEWIPNPNPPPAVDWAAEAAAGRPVLGPVVPAAKPASRKSVWARLRAALRG